MLYCPYCRSPIDDSDLSLAGALVACAHCGGHLTMPGLPPMQPRATTKIRNRTRQPSAAVRALDDVLAFTFAIAILAVILIALLVCCGLLGAVLI